MHHRFARLYARRPYTYRHPARVASAPSRDRAHIAHALLAASHVQAHDPDAAALLLDGVLGDLIDLWARSAAPAVVADRAAALRAMDAAVPSVAWRIRIALRSRAPEARLAHCWAILEALTTAPTTRISYHSRQLRAHQAHIASHDALSPIRTERMA
jgi:hypothetical protein